MSRFIWMGFAAAILAETPTWPASAEVRIGDAVFPSIAAAISAAPDRAVIEIGSGTYAEALVIGKVLTLRGVDTGAGRPRIDGGTGPSAVTVTAPGVTIEGLDVTASAGRRLPFGVFAAYSEEACVMIRGSGATVRNSRIEGCHHGVFVRAGDGFSLEDNEITANRFGGIMVLNTHGGTISGNRVLGNAYNGIAVGSVVFPPGMLAAMRPVAGDVIISEEHRSLQAAMSADIEISGNTVRDNGHTGIGVGTSTRIRILGNEVEDNGGAAVPRSTPPFIFGSSDSIRGYGIGLICDAHDNVVEENHARRNASHGILLDKTHANLVAANTVTENEVGIGLFGSTSNRIATNTVTGNSQFGIRVERGLPANLPSVLNVIVGNDLSDNHVNAFDTSGKDTAAPQAQGAPAEPAISAADRQRPNQWDEDGRGNHHSDFDEPSEGFEDLDGDGIGERVRPIPGGSAVDAHPMKASVIDGLLTPPTLARIIAACALPECGVAGNCIAR